MSVCSSALPIWLLVCGRREKGMGPRGGQDADSSLDQGGLKVLTVRLSHPPSPAGTKSPGYGTARGSVSEKGDGLFRGAGWSREKEERERKRVVIR